MHSKPNPLNLIIRSVLGIVLFAGFVWFNFQTADLGKGGAEFYVQWASGRRLAFQSEDPYAGQLIYPTVEGFGALKPGSQTYRYNTPIYSLILVFPFLLLENFQLSYSIWLIFNGIILVILFWSGLSFTGWKPRSSSAVMLGIFIAMGFYTIQALGSGSLIILAGALVMLAFLALQTDKMELAGILIALTTVQPHFFLLLYVLLILWGISRRKWNFVIWFLATIIFLSVIGFFFVPDWMLSYLRIVWHFKANFSTTTQAELLLKLLPGLGKQLGWFLTALMVLLCGVEWLSVRGKEPRWLFWTACITLVASQWIGLPVDPGEYFILVIPAMLITAISAQRTEKSGFNLIGLLLVTFFLAPWLVAWRAGLSTELLNPGWLLYFLPPFFLLIGLYWIRWWAIRPQRLYIEELRSNETV